MLAYWMLFFTLAFASLVHSPSAAIAPTVLEGRQRPQRRVIPIVVAILLILMIGLRYRVGGDWFAYLMNLDAVRGRSLSWAFANSPDEVGYTFITWLVGRIGGEIWLVNLICAVPFVIGLMAIARRQPNPYLALTIACPLIIIVVGMGYTRQAAALGFLLIGITALTKGASFWSFLIWTFVGSLFHLSVLFFIPVTAALLFQGRLRSLVLLLLCALAGYFVILPHAVERYSAGYIRTVYEAQGAIFRIALSALAGIVILVFGRRFFYNPMEARIWRGWGFLSVISLIMLFIVRSTVIIDRLSVYLLPIQIYTFSRVPLAFGGHQSQRIWSLLMVFAYAIVLFLWLILANNAEFWLPYRIYPVFS